MPNLDETGFVITGATGWLGRATLELLDASFGDANRVFAYSSRPTEIVLRSGRRVPSQALDTLRDLPQGRYHFLHYAFLTKDRVATLPPAEYVRLNEAISGCVVGAAKRVELGGIFLPSSGAVYREDRTLNHDIEHNPYGAMKVRDEERFAALAEELQRPLAIARVFNLAGPYINKIGNYALSSILDDIIHERPVQLNAKRRVVRSYVHVCDMIALALACIANRRAEGTLIFDTAGEVNVEVGELARLALEVMGRPDGQILRPALSDEAEDYYVGDRTAMAALAASHGIDCRPLRQQIRDTADYLAG